MTTSPEEKTLVLKDKLNLYERILLQGSPINCLHPGGLALTQKMLSFQPFPKEGVVLDLGCGSGSTVNLLTHQGVRAYGVDKSFWLLQEGGRIQDGVGRIQGDALALPLADQSLDSVLAECSLSVFSRTDQVLQELNRVMRPMAMLLFSDLYARDPAGLHALRQALPDSCFARAFLQKELFLSLERAGFLIVDWSDESESLRSIPGDQLIDTYASLSGTGEDALGTLLLLTKARLGYFICAARKID